MTREELIDYLEVALDLSFSYKGQWYFIGKVFDPKTGIYLEPEEYTCGRSDTEDDYRYFSVDEALANFKIEGKPLKEILPDIDW